MVTFAPRSATNAGLEPHQQAKERVACVDHRLRISRPTTGGKQSWETSSRRGGSQLFTSVSSEGVEAEANPRTRPDPGAVEMMVPRRRGRRRGERRGGRWETGSAAGTITGRRNRQTRFRKQHSPRNILAQNPSYEQRGEGKNGPPDSEKLSRIYLLCADSEAI